MHTVQLLLKTSKYERHEIDRRFHALAHLHNVCVKHARKCMIRLQHDKRYAELRQLYNELVKKEKMSKEEKSQKKKLAKQLAACRTEQGLSKASLEHYLKVCGKQFSKLLSSQQVQAEADRVWCGVERCLFGNGKELHFKKLMDFDTIGGKSNKNGARFDLDAMHVNWLGLSLKCYLPKSENSLSYVWESLKGKISYCNIKRLMFSSGWRYYAEIVVSGAAPTRVSIGTSTMGIDPGVSTIAGVSEDACVLEELAPNAIQYEKKIQKISQRMDRSRRISNPNKYNEDGTINRSNRDPWKYSKNYVKMRRLLKSLYRKKHAYIIDSHRELCNKLITIAKYFPVEKMHFQALQKKPKETKRQEKKTEVKQKDGTVKVIQKYKRKKRFGRSINRRAPARFLLELKRKAEAVGGVYAEVDTKEFKVMNTLQGYICNSRPRRFGKSITANMLTAYYSKGCDSQDLFAGLKISEASDFKKHLNQYDVIHLDIQLREYDKA